MLEEVVEFELGRFLLENKGLNGFWTAYVILHGPQKQNLSPLEDWALNKAPVVKATQERFKIFREHLQSRVKDDAVFASVPCGLMDDLLGLDYTNAPNAKLMGIDLDQNSLDLAAKNAENLDKSAMVNFANRNAWNLGVVDACDVLTSNGLNIYEKDDDKVIELYKQFYKALKTGGTLITSFLTPPPMLSPESSWKNFELQDVLKQKALFADVLQTGWQCFRTERQTLTQLEAAGFKNIQVIYDSQGMFPTVIAEK